MIDGFTLNPNILDLPARYAWQSIQSVRRAAQMRQHEARWHVIPPQLSQTVQARGVFSHQVQLIPGTVIWGINCHAITGALADFDLEVIDTDRNLGLSRVPIAATAYAVNGSPIRPVILGAPKIVIGSGLWQVKIHNRADTDGALQVLLYAMEPVRGAV